jgi:hypothetical protein
MVERVMTVVDKVGDFVLVFGFNFVLCLAFVLDLVFVFVIFEAAPSSSFLLQHHCTREQKGSSVNPTTSVS